GSDAASGQASSASPGGGGAPDSGIPPTAGPLPAIGNRQDIDFNLDWKHLPTDATGAEAKAFADAGWTYVDLPHTTKFVTPENPSAALGISWYRKHFTIPASVKGKKVFLEFGAAMQLADVWINGTHKLQHQGGYTPFTVDITQDVAYDGTDNVVAAKLDNNASNAFPPGKPNVDFYYYGGLYRNVTLHVTDLLHVTDPIFAGKVAGGGVFVTTPAASAASATVSVKTNVINESATPKMAGVLSEILDRTGAVVGTTTSNAMIAAGASSDFAQTISVTGPKLWHPDTPYLYTLRTTVLDGTTAVDGQTTRIGLRRIGWSHAGGLTLNGARYKALGVNIHEDTYGLGNALPDLAYYYEVKRMKEGGVNFVRASHFPHSPAFYDACDALGVLVLNPQSGWQSYTASAAFDNASYQELRDLIRRDRNHPSVVAWDASLNETSFPDAWALQTHTIVHQEYPGDQAFSAQWKFAHADISLDATQHGVRASTDTRPIIIDEYGDWDYGGGSSTTRQAREAGETAMLTQVRNVVDGTALNYALSWYSAGAYWDYEDYGGGFSSTLTRSGLVDMYRLPKFAYYFFQSQRDPAVMLDGVDSGPMAYIASFWQAGSSSSVTVYSNCDQISLYKDNTLVSTRSPDTGATSGGGSLSSLPHAPFTFAGLTFSAGTLRADCLLGGTKRASFTRQTPGAATAIRLRPEGTTLVANASDARLVFIDAVDANGTVVPGNSAQVALQVSGAGSLVGPATVTMKGGQLAAWVRSSRTAGTVTLTATATGLTPGTLSLTSQAVSGLPALPAGR
ncbi:MAG: hypothetical protein M3O36_17120, partial [Myxococcota bacterium]|nr:hypothetical protein [Myxococcota bacterium]